MNHEEFAASLHMDGFGREDAAVKEEMHKELMIVIADSLPFAFRAALGKEMKKICRELSSDGQLRISIWRLNRKLESVCIEAMPKKAVYVPEVNDWTHNNAGLSLLMVNAELLKKELKHRQLPREIFLILNGQANHWIGQRPLGGRIDVADLSWYDSRLHVWFAEEIDTKRLLQETGIRDPQVFTPDKQSAAAIPKRMKEALLRR